MSLDITVKIKTPIICPNCGEVVTTVDKAAESSSGRTWYPILEKLGYYVPYELRNEHNDWYGKDMYLSKEQIKELYDFVCKGTYSLYFGVSVKNLLANAIANDEVVAINADW